MKPNLKGRPDRRTAFLYVDSSLRRKWRVIGRAALYRQHRQYKLSRSSTPNFS